MDGVQVWLERDVIVGILGVYLLVNNDSGGRGCWKFISEVCSVKPDSENNDSGKNKSTWGQGAGYDEGVVVLHESSG